MAQAISISLSKFTSSVQAAVKAAAKHPKFKVEGPHAVTVAFLIRGFPVPENIGYSGYVRIAQRVALLCNETPSFRGFCYTLLLTADREIAILFIKTPLFGGFCYRE